MHVTHHELPLISNLLLHHFLQARSIRSAPGRILEPEA